jgi:hypothetical protein
VWSTQSQLHLTTLNVHPDKLAGGWDLVTQGSLVLPTTQVSAHGSIFSAVAAQWHSLLLVEAPLASAPLGASVGAWRGGVELVVVSRITGQVVQQCEIPRALGGVLRLTTDPLHSSAVSACDAAGGAVGRQGAAHFIAGRRGLLQLSPLRTAVEVWTEFVSTGDFGAALGLINELKEELRFAALESGEADVATHVQRLKVAEAQVRHVMACEACARGVHPVATNCFLLRVCVCDGRALNVLGCAAVHLPLAPHRSVQSCWKEAATVETHLDSC